MYFIDTSHLRALAGLIAVSLSGISWVLLDALLLLSLLSLLLCLFSLCSVAQRSAVEGIVTDVRAWDALAELGTGVFVVLGRVWVLVAIGC